MDIMIVDDAMFMRTVLKNMVEKGGHTVVSEAGTVDEAVRNYKTLPKKPDVVLMDITMPNKDGIEGVKELIQINPDIKIIMCSAMGQQVMVVDAMKAGARDFLVKPVEEERLNEALHKITG